jgi:IBR domain, a half RING-finger domain
MSTGVSSFAAQKTALVTDPLSLPYLSTTAQFSQISGLYLLFSITDTRIGRLKILLTRIEASKVPGFTWSIFPGCESGQIHDTKGHGDDDVVFSCQSCNQHSCISCDTRWHEGRTCQEYQRDCRPQYEATTRDVELAQEKKSSEALIKKLTRKCPGLGCGAQIMKDKRSDDCDKMKCKLLPSTTIRSELLGTANEILL